MQAEPLAGQVLANDCHAEVRAVLAAILPRERIAVVAGGVRPAAHLGEQGLPLLARQAAPVPVRASVLPPVVEEPLVVVLGLKRLDLPLDEVVEVGEVVDEVLRQVEVHGVSEDQRAVQPVDGQQRPTTNEDTSLARKSAAPSSTG